MTYLTCAGFTPVLVLRAVVLYPFAGAGDDTAPSAPQPNFRHLASLDPRRFPRRRSLRPSAYLRARVPPRMRGVADLLLLGVAADKGFSKRGARALRPTAMRARRARRHRSSAPWCRSSRPRRTSSGAPPPAPRPSRHPRTSVWVPLPACVSVRPVRAVRSSTASVTRSTRRGAGRVVDPHDVGRLERARLESGQRAARHHAVKAARGSVRDTAPQPSRAAVRSAQRTRARGRAAHRASAGSCADAVLRAQVCAEQARARAPAHPPVAPHGPADPPARPPEPPTEGRLSSPLRTCCGSAGRLPVATSPRRFGAA